MTEQHSMNEPNKERIIAAANIILIAPTRYPLAIGIDTRPSFHTNPMAYHFDLAQLIKPCPEIPIIFAHTHSSQSLPVIFKDYDSNQRAMLANLVQQNAINFFNNQRNGITDEPAGSAASTLLFISSFSEIKKTLQNQIMNSIKMKSTPEFAAATKEHFSKMAEWEHSDVGYITGANGSDILWQREPTEA